MSDCVEIFEVGPRDGLQNEPHPVALAEKIALVDKLSGAGFGRIEAASFVSPKWVPQMADSEAVMAGIARPRGVRFAALTPNEKGLERAIASGVDEVSVFGAASEAFCKANINATIEESLARFAPVVTRAKAAGLFVRGYVSVVVDCPYSGAVAPGLAAQVARALWEMGCDEISLGDTTGQGTPDTIGAMLDAVLDHIPAASLVGHYHDTNGRALDNIELTLDKGLRIFDAAIGGLGGCPYSPGATGNVASEAVAERLTQLGYCHGLDMAHLNEAAILARSMRGPKG